MKELNKFPVQSESTENNIKKLKQYLQRMYGTCIHKQTTT